MRYRGRFAPSPTGPLHFGSLVAALGSFLDARQHGGRWLLRMEDLDRPRTVAGAADAILATLEAFGLHWDGSIEYQSRRTEAYREASDYLRKAGLAYPCACARKELRAQGRPGAEGPIYAGTCRNGLPNGRPPRTLRVRTHGENIAITDRIQGLFQQRLESEVGDFIIHRADGLYAYQLAVIVDDAWQGINHVVRGADLLFSTPRQIYLQGLLGLPLPTYAHLPVATGDDGRKLSKQGHAPAVQGNDPIPALLAALRHLHQPLPSEPPDQPGELLEWAITHWQIERIPAVKSLKIPAD